MAYHDDLIEHAVFLSQLNSPDEPKQVDLRRAVSAAYYALFHLLTTEAAQNWRWESQRHRFARMFDHGCMKKCSARLASRPLPSDQDGSAGAADLKLVAEAFVTLQEARHIADYDNALEWSRTQVYELIAETRDAMAAWQSIRGAEIAQEYLFELIATR